MRESSRGGGTNKREVGVLRWHRGSLERSDSGKISALQNRRDRRGGVLQVTKQTQWNKSSEYNGPLEILSEVKLEESSAFLQALPREQLSWAVNVHVTRDVSASLATFVQSVFS